MPDQPTPADAPGDFQLSQEPVTPSAEAPAAPAAPAPAYEYLGELPASYGTASVYLVAYDPRRLFAYWDLDAEAVAAVDAPLGLRVCRAEGGEVESQVDIGRATGLTGGVAAGGGPGRYLPVNHSGGDYHVELGTGGGATGMPWRRLAVSNPVVVPPEGVAAAEDVDARFATLPFHLSFQRLAELLRATVQTEGRPLTEALAGLQFDAHATTIDPVLVEALGRLDEEQRENLQTVLGWEFGPSSANFLGSPGEAGGSEALSSAGFSALAAGGVSSGGGSGGLTAAGAGSSPASGFAARAAGGSESLTAGRSVFSGSFATGNLAGAGSGAFLGPRGAGASGVFGPAPSSEAWRRAVTTGAVAGSSGGSDQFARERAERFLRAVTSSLDVLSPLFSGNLAAGASSSGGSPG